MLVQTMWVFTEMFTIYYCSEVKNHLDNGTGLDDVEIDLHLSKIKPLHAQWLIDTYNHFTTEKGQQIIIKVGRKQVFIIYLLYQQVSPSPEDPFESIYHYKLLSH